LLLRRRHYDNFGLLRLASRSILLTLERFTLPRTGLTGMDSWASVPELLRSGGAPLPAPWEGVFGPLRSGNVDEVMAVGQLGQSLDGRVATPTGHSHYINGPAGLAHLHRLRALVDAVVIGIGTALADDPQLPCGACRARTRFAW
jgi:hypothetical protein